MLLEVFHFIYAFLISKARNLRWMGFRIPLTILNKAHQANQLYPFAISLSESVHTYDEILKKVGRIFCHFIFLDAILCFSVVFNSSLCYVLKFFFM